MGCIVSTERRGRSQRAASTDSLTHLRRRSPFGKCAVCGHPLTNSDWCSPCKAICLAGTFALWTSGNDKIDSIVRASQLTSKAWDDYLEWISPEYLTDMRFNSSGSYGTLYRARWVWNDNADCDYEDSDDSDDDSDDDDDHHHNRYSSHSEEKSCASWRYATVALLDMGDVARNVTPEFLAQLKPQLRCLQHDDLIRVYGITRSVDTGRYLLVLESDYLSIRTRLYAPQRDGRRHNHKRTLGCCM